MPANIIYNKVKKNQVLWIKTTKQKICKPEKREQQKELDKE